jgi:hypothetical protein
MRCLTGLSAGWSSQFLRKAGMAPTLLHLLQLNNNQHSKTEILAEKPAPVPYCKPQSLLGLNPGLSDGKRGCNHLSHGIVLVSKNMNIKI